MSAAVPPITDADGKRPVTNTPPLRPRERLAVAAILTIHSALLVYSGAIHSPAWDEVGHLPAGIAHWQTGVFDLYRVNPPLVRLWATALPFVTGARLDFDDAPLSGPPWRRTEFVSGEAWIRADAAGFMHHLRLARWSVIPFSLWAGLLCFAAARRLYGIASGFVALTLWCTSPMVIGHGSLITPDIGAAATGAIALWTLADWASSPSRSQFALAGVALGLALLTKFTNLLLLGVLAAIVIYRCVRPGDRQPQRDRWCWQACLIGLLVLYLIALGYGFERVGKGLGDYRFISSTLAGPQSARQEPFGNRFTDTSLGLLRIPLPENYLSGIDVQKRDFEAQMPSYLRGEWKRGGWWCYYVYAFVIKEPVATLSLLLAAVVQLPFLPRNQRGLTLWWVLLPIVVIFGFVSAQTGFNHHLRYVLPAYPFMYVLASSLVAKRLEHSRWRTTVTVALVVIATAESMSAYPHSIVFFNQAIGGPDAGWRHLNHSNVDWGQNVLQLGEWARQHPEARPLQVIFSGGFDPKYLPIWDGTVTHGDLTEAETALLKEGRLHDRWVAISVNKLVDTDPQRDRYGPLRRREPEAKVAYTYYVYNLKSPKEKTQP